MLQHAYITTNHYITFKKHIATTIVCHKFKKTCPDSRHKIVRKLKILINNISHEGHQPIKNNSLGSLNYLNMCM